MDPAKYEPWWQSLDEGRRAEVLGIDGVLPDWMTVSLDEAGILTFDVELPDGTMGRMMSTRFREFLETKSRAIDCVGSAQDQVDVRTKGPTSESNDTEIH